MPAPISSRTRRPLEKLPKANFVRAWSSIAYLFPGLHPDGFEDADSGWPRVLRRFAAEAWRRADAGELDDAELYTSDAQWSGLYDQMKDHTPDESHRAARRLAASFVGMRPCLTSSPRRNAPLSCPGFAGMATRTPNLP